MSGEGAGEHLLAPAFVLPGLNGLWTTAPPARPRAGADKPEPISSRHSGLASSLPNQTSPKSRMAQNQPRGDLLISTA